MPRRTLRRRRQPRISKFTRRTRYIIYEALRARLPIVRACELAGVARDTYHVWMRNGEDPIKYPKHAQFRKRVKEIQADSEREALRIIRKVAKGNYKVTETSIETSPKGHTIKRVTKTKAPVWQAAAWYLERRLREHYGKDAIEQDDKTPEEMAQEIKNAADALFESVPNGL